MSAELLVATAAIAAAITLTLIRLLRPLLLRYALARPNARSGHRVPTPQGGGIAVLAAVMVAVGAGLAAGIGIAGELPGAAPITSGLAVLGLAALGIAVLGAVDDIRPLPVVPRLLAQALAVAAALFAAGDQARLLPDLPLWVERTVELLAGLWFVNLTNFMDGLDLMVVAHTVPLSATLVLLAATGVLPAAAGLVAAALLGAMLGFTPSNWPVARLFLGDVGSLAIGLLTAWLLFMLASRGAMVAAILLPLYFCADATLTLATRLRRRERVWQAHRDHIYQLAADRGMPPIAIVRYVVALNVTLAALALGSLAASTTVGQLVCLGLGCLLTGAVMARLAGRW